MDKIKIGQIGVGHAHASGKMKVLRASDEYEVIGVVEPNAALRERAAASATYDGLAWMTREQLLNVPGLKVVAVETQVRDLLDTAESCVDAGVHIHLDKPAGSSLAQYRRLLDKAAAAHLAVQMGYMYRYNPAVVLLRNMLGRGWLGEPFEVHTVMSKVVDPPARRALAEYPGGMMFELGCHIIDLVIGVLGKPEKVTPFYQHAAAIDDRLADNMLAVFTYAKALATVKTSAMEVEGGSRRHLVVCGSEGTLHIEPLDRPAVRLALSKPRDTYVRGYQQIEFEPYERYVGDIADLARIIRGEKDADFSYENDWVVQSTLLEACWIAAK